MFKTLPKTDNEALIQTLELDNKFDYEKSVRIEANDTGYEIIEDEPTSQSAMEEKKMKKIEVKQTEAHKQMSEPELFNEKK